MKGINEIRAALRNVNGAADRLQAGSIGLSEALIRACGKPGTKAADEAFKAVRKTICADAKSINETLQSCAGKAFADLTPQEQACRNHRTLSVTWSKLQPAKKGAGKRARKVKGGKVAVTKVTGTSKAQIAALATKPDRFRGMLTVALTTLQGAEAPKYKDVPGLVAALQAAIALCE